MIATLTFNLPEENDEEYCARYGGRFRSALSEVDNKLREMVKYGGSPRRAAWAGELRTFLHEALDGLDLYGEG